MRCSGDFSNVGLSLNPNTKIPLHNGQRAQWRTIQKRGYTTTPPQQIQVAPRQVCILIRITRTREGTRCIWEGPQIDRAGLPEHSREHSPQPILQSMFSSLIFRATRSPMLKLCLFVVMVLPGCGVFEDFSGRWRTSSGQENITVFNNAAAIELRLGHYGGEVAGTLSPFQDSYFAVPTVECPCMYIQNGTEYEDTMTFVLDTQSCPELGLSGQLIMELNREGSDAISGTLTQLDENKEVLEVKNLAFTRSTDGSQTVLPYERGCALPTPSPKDSSDSRATPDAGEGP